VPTCQPHERLGDLEARMSEGWAWCAVVNADGVLLGRVRRRAVADSPSAAAEEAMDAGPSTYRPSTPAAEMLDVMTKGRFERAFVTDADGRLLGLVGRQDLEAAVSAARAASRRG
jgi:CBS domain-containing protein